MKLQRFRVSNYRSVKDSGWVDTGQRSVLVGRNESGKSNLLLALATLKPPGKLEPLDASCDFPADLPPNSCTPDLGVVETVWALSEQERQELARILPGAADVTHVEVGRSYEPEYWVRFPGASESAIEVLPAESEISDPPIATAVDGGEAPTPSADGAAADDALDVLDSLGAGASSAASGDALSPAVETLGAASPADEKEACEWVINRLPTFLYIDEFPEVEGSQNLADYVRLKSENRLEARHHYFEKLLALADLEPSVAETLLSADSSMRRRIASHAGRVVTQKLQQVWTDRALKVRFDLDGDQFNTLVCDANSSFDVEINLNQRSRGFRWFFSFYVSFAAHSSDQREDSTLLLLDEPAMHLHAVGQRDFVDQLTANLNGQVVLATQSPFLVPTDDLACVRTVTISEQGGTQVSNELAGDSMTMLPIVHALGTEISRALLDDSWSLVVEGLTDYWYLLGASNVLREAGSSALPAKLSICPAGSSSTVLYMTGLLSDGGVPAVVLRSTRSEAFERLPGSLGDAGNVIFVADALPDAREAGADVEDLIDPKVYEHFVRSVHKNQLQDHALQFDPRISRTVRRYRDAFGRAGLSFHRERVARAFMRMLLQNADSVLPPASRANFERLFGMIRDRFEALRD